MTKAPRPAGRFNPAFLVVPLGGLVLLAAGALVAAWLDRNALGARLAIDYLARRGVPARIRLTRLDAGGAEGALVLGPPAHPTLSVPHFVAEFSPAPVFGAPRLSRVVLVRPQLELGYDGRRLDFGALQPLVEAARRAPKGGAPAPDVVVRQGDLRLRTPYGPMAGQVDGELAQGAVRSADIELRPADLSLPRGRVRALAAEIHVRPFAPHRYVLSAQARAAAASGPGGEMRGLVLALDAEAPFDPAASTPWAGPLRAQLHGTAQAMRADGARASGLQLEAALAGSASGRLDAPRFEGHATAMAQAEAVGFGDTTLVGVTLDGQASPLGIDAAHAVSAQFAVRLGAREGHTFIDHEPIALSRVRIATAGSSRSDAAGPSFDATAGFAAAGGLDRRRASAMVASFVPASAGDLRAALAGALTDVAVSAPAVGLSGGLRAWRVRLVQPLRARAASGATLTVSGLGGEGGTGSAAVLRGNGAVALDGGGLPSVRLAFSNAEFGTTGARGRVEGDASGSAGPIRDGRLGFVADVDARRSGTRVALARCATAALGAWRGEGSAPLVRAASVQVCPSPSGPLLTARNGAWRAAAEVKDLEAASPAAQVSVAASGISLQAAGRGQAMDGQARVAQAVLRDAATPKRFEPLVVSGPIRLAAGRTDGALDVALLSGGRRLGRAQLEDNLRTGAGGLQFDAPRLILATGGLQPASVLPGLASLGQDVAGPARVSVAVNWRGSAVTSSAHVELDGVQVKTAAGLASGVRTNLFFTDLAPLTSAPGQRLTADRLAAVLPLTDVAATYALGDDALTLDAAQADLASGRIWLAPMHIGLTPGAPLAGVVHVDGVQLGTVLDAFNLARAVSIQARIGGTLPFAFGPEGLRIADGRFAALGPGRISLHRQALSAVAAGGAGAPASSGMQDFAYQALEDLAFSELDARVASQPGGRLGVLFHIRGRHDPPVAKPARIGLFALLRGHAFDKPIPLPKGTEVNLTLDSSLNLDDLLAAYLRRPSAGSAQVQP